MKNKTNMKLKLGKKTESGFQVVDEMGNEIFIFTGLHLDDLRQFLNKINNEGGSYSRSEQI